MARPSLLLPLIAVALVATAAVAAPPVDIIEPQPAAQLFGRAPIAVAIGSGAVARVELLVDGTLIAVLREPPWQIDYDFGDSGRARTIEVRVHAPGYGSVSKASVVTGSFGAAAAIDVDLVEVPVTIDSRRPPQLSDLIVREDGVVQELRALKSSREAAHFLFVVDRSLSMSSGKLEAALEGIEAALAHLRPDDSASLVFFNHRVDRPVALRRSLPPAAADMEPSGGTALRDALASIEPGRRSVVVAITDGGDRNSVSDRAAVRAAVTRANVVVYGVSLGRGEGADLLRGLASATGGTFATVSHRSLSVTLVSFMRDINSRWVAVYQSSSKSDGWRSIEVRSQRRGVSVRDARKGYLAE